MIVDIRKIADELEMQSDDYLSFLNLDTGEVETVSKELLSEIEESEEEYDKEHEDDEEWKLGVSIVTTDRWVRLPTKRDVHDWEIMESFAESLEPGKARGDLERAVHGSGAFRNFRAALDRHKLKERWYAFRTAALRDIAIEWCEEHKLQWK